MDLNPVESVQWGALSIKRQGVPRRLVEGSKGLFSTSMTLCLLKKGHSFTSSMARSKHCLHSQNVWLHGVQGATVEADLLSDSQLSSVSEFNMAANVKHLLIVPGHYQCGPMQRQRQSSCGRSTGRHKMQEQKKLKSSKRIDTTGLINGRATISAASLWHVPFRYHSAPILESHLHFLVLAAGWRRWWCSFVHHGCKVIYWLRATLTAWNGSQFNGIVTSRFTKIRKCLSPIQSLYIVKTLECIDRLTCIGGNTGNRI